jgi:hypothetical protein
LQGWRGQYYSPEKPIDCKMYRVATVSENDVRCKQFNPQPIKGAVTTRRLLLSGIFSSDWKYR